MPSSLIVVALVVAWLVVLVPMIVRKRQEIAKTADSALTGRVVRKGGAEEADVRDASLMDAETDDRDIDDEDLDDGNDSTTERDEALDTTVEADDRDHVRYSAVTEPGNEAAPPRRYRPGRGGFDPEAAALTARAKYAFRQRVVVAMLLLAIGSAVVAAVMYPMAWWAHGAIDLTLVAYLSYLRRQVRIEEEIRQRRMARIAQARRAAAAPRKAQQRQQEVDYGDQYDDQYEEPEERPEPAQTVVSAAKATPPPRITHPHAVVVDIDDEDPAFDELDDLDSLRYRRAAGE